MFLPQGSEFIVLLLVLALIILPIILCVKRAEKLSRNKIVWGILGFLFGFIAVLILYVLTEPKQEK